MQLASGSTNLRWEDFALDCVIYLWEPDALSRLRLLEELGDVSIDADIRAVSDAMHLDDLASMQPGTRHSLLLARSEWLRAWERTEASQRRFFILPLVTYDPEFTARLELRRALYVNLPASAPRWERKLREAMFRMECDACWRNQLLRQGPQDSGEGDWESTAKRSGWWERWRRFYSRHARLTPSTLRHTCGAHL